MIHNVPFDIVNNVFCMVICLSQKVQLVDIIRDHPVRKKIARYNSMASQPTKSLPSDLELFQEGYAAHS